jgi:hypothetical protein
MRILDHFQILYICCSGSCCSASVISGLDDTQIRDIVNSFFKPSTEYRWMPKSDQRDKLSHAHDFETKASEAQMRKQSLDWAKVSITSTQSMASFLLLNSLPNPLISSLSLTKPNQELIIKSHFSFLRFKNSFKGFDNYIYKKQMPCLACNGKIRTSL